MTGCADLFKLTVFVVDVFGGFCAGIAGAFGLGGATEKVGGVFGPDGGIGGGLVDLGPLCAVLIDAVGVVLGDLGGAGYGLGFAVLVAERNAGCAVGIGFRDLASILRVGIGGGASVEISAACDAPGKVVGTLKLTVQGNRVSGGSPAGE